jgi:putative ABC transport system permease protein
VTFFRDLRFGVRALRRNPTFAAAALGLMAIGTGATTAVFSVVKGILLTPLPYREPNRIVLFRADLRGYPQQPLLTGEEKEALRDRTDLFESVASVYQSEGNLTSGDEIRAVRAAAVSENFLETLGVTPAVGRSVSHPDNGTLLLNTVDISDDVWRRDFSGDPDIVGRRIEINNSPRTVAGVLPKTFRLLIGAGVAVDAQEDLVFLDRGGDGMNTYRGFTVIARLRRGVTVAAAQAAIDTLMATFVAEHSGSYSGGPARVSLRPIDQDVVSQVRPALLAIAGAVGFVLAVTCANLMNLLLARASTRSRELALRAAVGASRAQILGQLVAEGVVIGVLGACGGLLVALWAVDGLRLLAPAALPQRGAIAVDRVVAAGAMVAGLVTAMLVSLVPAWGAAKTAFTPVLKRDPASSRGAAVTRGALVAGQFAVSLVLLIGAGLMIRAFVSLHSTPLGFDPYGAMTMKVHLQLQRFNTTARKLQFYRQLQTNASRLPGADRIGIGLPVPMGGDPLIERFSLGPQQPEHQAEGVVALSGYLEALRVRLISGRYFGSNDDERSVAIVDERLADQMWPHRSPVGQQVILSPRQQPQTVEIIGVVSHVAMRDRRDSGLPQIWLAYAVEPYAAMDIVARGPNPITLMDSVKRSVTDLKPGRAVSDLRLLDDYVDAATADTRFALSVLAIFAAVAVILTAIGIYGVVAYTTARRMREIAVRIAIGASGRQIMALVMREGVLWTGLGLGAGLLGARLLTRYLAALLYRVGPNDATTFVAVVVGLGAVVLVSMAVPVLRALHVDPLRSLRNE